jgi:catechol 2,3-dioxygenase-like lactoylglutathione lyase family enzyme
MTASVRLGGVSIDSADPVGLAAFYRDFLGLTTVFEQDSFVALSGAGVLLTMQRVDDHQPPSWPDGERPKQLHLELAVDDLDAAEARALELGAVKPERQPSPDRWRVLLDPAGHPFCLTTQIPDL